MALSGIFKPSPRVIFPEEEEALWKVIGNRKINTLMAAGSHYHIEHCFRLGLPDIMILFDPEWKRSAQSYQSDVEQLLYFCDKKPEFTKRGNEYDVLQFGFQGRTKTIYFFKREFRQDEQLVIQFQPDIFHNGHAEVSADFFIKKRSMLFLKKGAIIMNVFRLDDLQDFIYGHFLLEFKAAYSPGFFSDGRVYTIFEKQRDFTMTEMELIYECARIANTRFKFLIGEEENKEIFGIVTNFYKREIEPNVTDAQKKRILEIASDFETKHKDELKEAVSLF